MFWLVIGWIASFFFGAFGFWLMMIAPDDRQEELQRMPDPMRDLPFIGLLVAEVCQALITSMKQPHWTLCVHGGLVALGIFLCILWANKRKKETDIEYPDQ